MDKTTQVMMDDLKALAEGARELLAATADVAEEKVNKARERLAAAVDSGQQLYGRVRDKSVEGVKVANQALHDHPYQGIGLVVGVGAVVGYLIGRRFFCNGDASRSGTNSGQLESAAPVTGWNSKSLTKK